MGGAERSAPLEVRAAGRTLTGEAIRYGQRATDRAERFEAGAFQPLGDVALNLQHDPTIVLATTADRLAVTDTPTALEVRASLRPGAALTLLQRGALRGLSVEFRSLAERRGGGVRVIERAALEAIGLVDTGSYAGRLEVRRRGGGGYGYGGSYSGGYRGGGGRSLGTMRSTVPTGTRVACDCAGDPVERFAIMAAEGISDVVEEAFAIVEQELGIAISTGFEVTGIAARSASGGGDLVAAWHTFAQPLASVRRGTLRFTEADGGGLGVEIDLPDTEAGRAVLEAQAVAGIVVRPLIDRRAAEWATEELPTGERVAVYSRWPLRGVIVSSTDRREGWPEPTFTPSEVVAEAPPPPDAEPPAERAALSAPRRRLWL